MTAPPPPRTPEPTPPHTPADGPVDDVDGLRHKLASLPVIEQAKGVLMVMYGIDADTAFTVLKRWSSTLQVKVRVLAADLVGAATRPHERPFGSVRDLLVDLGLDGAPPTPEGR